MNGSYKVDANGTLFNVSAPTALLPPAIARLARGDQMRVDIGIERGRIAMLRPSRAAEGEDASAQDLDGAMVWPCFSDCHAHLDKSHTWPRSHDTDGSFLQSLRAVLNDRRHWNPRELKTRMDFSLRCAYLHGTKALRTHLDDAVGQDEISWAVFREVREEWKGRIALQAASLSPVQFYADPETSAPLADLVAEMDGVLGAYIVWPAPDLERSIENFLAAAEARDLCVDMHVDESGDPDAAGLKAVAEAILRRRFKVRVLVGHCCSLALQRAADMERTLDLVAASGVSIVCLPLTNVHLQDRQSGRTPRWRGITLVKELAAHGVPVAMASDNVRDAFFQYGDHDMLEVYREATKLGHLDYPVGHWPRAVTEIPASIMDADPARIEVGNSADLVLFSARTFSELLARPQSDRRILRGGNWIEGALPDFRELDRLSDDSQDMIIDRSHVRC